MHKPETDVANTHPPLPQQQQTILRQVIEEIIPFNKFLHMELQAIRRGYARIRLPFAEHLIGNPRKPALHGGVVATLIDTVGGAAAMTTLLSMEDRISTIDLRTDYLRFAEARELIGEAWLVRSGNRLVVTDMQVHHGDPQRLIARGVGVYNVQRMAQSDKPLAD